VTLLDHKGFDCAVIGRQSLGGFMSMAVALAHPARLRVLLLVDTRPGYKSDDMIRPAIRPDSREASAKSSDSRM